MKGVPRTLPLLLLLLLDAVGSSVGEEVPSSTDPRWFSLGKLKPYMGDLRSSDGLRAAASARSYNKELIIMATSPDQVLVTSQAIQNLRRFGIEHVLLLSKDGSACRQLATHLRQYGCAWDSYVLPRPKDEAPEFHEKTIQLWHVRWRTTARAIRLGYNVLCSDTDVIFFDNPYRFLKSFPFSDYVIINQPEVLWSEDAYEDVMAPNGGVVYIQNASPSGPAAWLLAEVTDRSLRMLDDGWETLMGKGGTKYCNRVDQDVFTDALSSVMTGKVLFAETIRVCMRDYGKEHEQEYAQLVGAVADLMQDSVKSSTVQLPPWMEPVAGKSEVIIRTIDMKMPHIGAQWNETLGGNMYGSSRQAASNAFIAELKSDCSDCPMWPDPEDPEAESAARETATEKFLFAPPFLMFNYYTRGRKGYWHADLHGGVAQQVIGHLHYNPAAGNQQVGKIMGRMSVGEYDWLAAHELLGTNVFRMSLNADGHVVNSPPRPNSDGRVPRLLALHPSVRLDLLNTLEEYQEIILGMAQVALASDRAVVFPDLPCNLSFIKRDKSDDSAPLNLNDMWFPRVPEGIKWPGEVCRSDIFGAYGGDNRSSPSGSATSSHPLGAAGPMCTLSMLSFDECFRDGKGMLQFEFEHVIRRYSSVMPLLPGKSNTMFWPAPSEHPDNVESTDIVVVKRSDVERAAEEYSRWRVVYLGSPVQVVNSGGEWAKGEAVKAEKGDICVGLGREPLRARMKYAFPESSEGITRWEGSIQIDGTLKKSNKKFTKSHSVIGAVVDAVLG